MATWHVHMYATTVNGVSPSCLSRKNQPRAMVGYVRRMSEEPINTSLTGHQEPVRAFDPRDSSAPRAHHIITARNEFPIP